MNQFARAMLEKQLTKIAIGGVGVIFATIGGVTTLKALQPAVEKASDYASRAVELYCELPEVDRLRFRSEVLERLSDLARAKGTTAADIRVLCPMRLARLDVR